MMQLSVLVFYGVHSLGQRRWMTCGNWRQHKTERINRRAVCRQDWAGHLLRRRTFPRMPWPIFRRPTVLQSFSPFCHFHRPHRILIHSPITRIVVIIAVPESCTTERILIITIAIITAAPASVWGRYSEADFVIGLSSRRDEICL